MGPRGQRIALRRHACHHFCRCVGFGRGCVAVRTASRVQDVFPTHSCCSPLALGCGACIQKCEHEKRKNNSRVLFASPVCTPLVTLAPRTRAPKRRCCKRACTQPCRPHPRASTLVHQSRPNALAGSGGGHRHTPWRLWPARKMLSTKRRNNVLT